MSDYAHDKTDRELAELERKIRREYDTARKEVQQKLNSYLAEAAKGEEKQRELLKAGKITKQEYNDWMTRKIGMGKRWEEMRDNLAQDMTNAGQIARSIADGYKPEVYALNHNWATYQIEHDGKIDTFYQLYDRQTVERLMEKDRQLMPPAGKRVRREIALGKAQKWNNKQLQSALTQSILQGESIPDMAKRVARTVATRSYADSVRYARTMITGAESAGRQDAYERAVSMGIDLEKEWIATLDDRTRHTHRQLHGERRPLDEEFSNGCMYPADPSGDDEEVYNCRCTTKAAIKGFEGDRVESSPKMGDMSFEEWQGAKAPKEKETEANTEDVNATGRTILGGAYEYHRTANNLRTVPLSELQSTSFISADYGNMSAESATAFNNALDGLTRDFDTPLTTIRAMSRDEFMAKSNAFAFVRHEYTADSAELVINTGKCKDITALRDRIKELANAGYCANIKPELANQYVAVHEFAHSILNMQEKLNDKTNWVNADYAKLRTARKEIADIYDRYTKDVGGLVSKRKEYEARFIFATSEDDFNKYRTLFNKASEELADRKISDYSLANIDEFMAEAFTNERIGQKSNPYGKEVMSVLEKHFGRSK